MSFFSLIGLIIIRPTHGFSPIRSMQHTTGIGMASAFIRNSNVSTTSKSSNSAIVKLMFLSYSPTLQRICFAIPLVLKALEFSAFNFVCFFLTLRPSHLAFMSTIKL